MNMPTSSIRGFFEILMPGVFLVLNSAITLYILTYTFTPELVTTLNTALSGCSSPSLFALLLLVLGYPVGVVLRLLKNDKIDSRSAAYIKFTHPAEREALYLNDHFFYNNWMKVKSKERLPEEAATFYEEYWADKDTGNGMRNTSFFNFCKTLVIKYDPLLGNEICGAEALSRFLAGSYYALQTSILLMLVNTAVALSSPRCALLPLIVTAGYLYLIHVILSQYRLLRCKEVESVFHACFANREHFERFFPMRSSRPVKPISKCSPFETRTCLIRDAWFQRQKGDIFIQSIDLNRLISLMKDRSSVHPYLSSLYFAGSEVDHPFFLENTKIAIGLAVLPEDSLKASVAKQHPHQTEIIIVIQGTLVLHYCRDGMTKQSFLKEGECFIIDKEVCHWITPVDETDAAYLFIKTNPLEEPRSRSR